MFDGNVIQGAELVFWRGAAALIKQSSDKLFASALVFIIMCYIIQMRLTTHTISMSKLEFNLPLTASPTYCIRLCSMFHTNGMPVAYKYCVYQ